MGLKMVLFGVDVRSRACCLFSEIGKKIIVFPTMTPIQYYLCEDCGLLCFLFLCFEEMEMNKGNI